MRGGNSVAGKLAAGCVGRREACGGWSGGEAEGNYGVSWWGEKTTESEIGGEKRKKEYGCQGQFWLCVLRGSSTEGSGAVGEETGRDWWSIVLYGRGEGFSRLLCCLGDGLVYLLLL